MHTCERFTERHIQAHHSWSNLFITSLYHCWVRKMDGLIKINKTKDRMTTLPFERWYASYFVNFCTPMLTDWLSLQWSHNERDGVSNHQHHDCLLNSLFRHRWTKTSKLRVTGLCDGNSPVTGEFPTQRASNAEKVSIWWRHHGTNSNTIILLSWCHLLTQITFTSPEIRA